MPLHWVNEDLDRAKTFSEIGPFLHSLIFRSSPRRWPSRLELRCVRPFRPYVHKKFSDFHLIWCVGRPRPHMRTSVTSTRSKVKVTELPKLRKKHFSRSISSAISAWCSKLMVGGHSMGPGLQLVRARFLNFHLGKHAGSPTRTVYVDMTLTWSKVKVTEHLNFCQLPITAGWPTCIVYVDVTLTRSKVKVTDHFNFRQLPINVHFQVYLLRHFRVNSKLTVDIDSMARRPIFEFLSRKGISRVQTSRNVDISRHSNGHIFRYWAMLHTVTWLGTLVVLHILRMLIWPWPDPRSRSWGFWTSGN